MKKISNPLIFLSSLGAGGISIIAFAFLQYVHPHGPGLISYEEISANAVWPMWIYVLIIAVMAVFTIIHLWLSVKLFSKLGNYLKSKEYKILLENPLTHTAILAPFISIVMTLNVFVGPVRFFVPALSENLQALMLPALIAWLIIGFFLLKTEFKLLAIAFKKGFDASKIHFGWLLHSFALSMYTVTGTGIAAMAKNEDIANTAFFVSVMTGSMGLFLFLVKIVAIFKSHYAAENLPEREFMPAFLIVLPNVTLYAISFFRIGHFLEHHHNAELSVYYLIVMTVAFAFSTWYLIFGFVLMSDFLKKEYFTKSYYVQLWGLVCPFVAYAVLGSFVYASFIQWSGFIVLIALSSFVAIYIFFDLYFRQRRCARNDNSMECIG